MKRKDLLDALTIVRPGLDSKESIEQATSFAFIDGRIVTYNDRISISHPIPGMEITGAINAEEFYQLLSKLKKDEIEISITENEVLMKSGRATAGFALQREIKLPIGELGKISAWKKLPEHFIDALKFAIPSCAGNVNDPILTCIHIRKDGYIESSDGFRIARFKVETMPISDGLLLPGSTASSLIKYNIQHVAETKGWIHFRVSDGGTVISCRVFHGSYHNTEPHLKVSGVTFTMPNSLGDVLDRAAIFSNQDQTHILNEQVTITIADNRMRISGKGDHGWFEEELNVHYTDEAVSFLVNPGFLMSILGQIKVCTLGKSSMKFEGENWEHVIALTSKVN